MKERNPTDLAEELRQNEERETAQQLEKHQRDEDLKAVMSTAAGRRFMRGLLDRCGNYRTSFTGNSTTFFNEGQRNIGLIYLADMEQTCPELLIQMHMEAIADKKAKK